MAKVLDWVQIVSFGSLTKARAQHPWSEGSKCLVLGAGHAWLSEWIQRAVFRIDTYNNGRFYLFSTCPAGVGPSQDATQVFMEVTG